MISDHVDSSTICPYIQLNMEREGSAVNVWFISFEVPAFSWVDATFAKVYVELDWPHSIIITE